MASDFNEDLIIKQIQALNDTNKFYDILSLISSSNSSHLLLNNTTEEVCTMYVFLSLPD